MLEPVYIALGSNLGRPEEEVRAGLEELAMLPDTRLARVSSLYRSAPVGYLDQPDFVNAVAQIETALPARVTVRLPRSGTWVWKEFPLSGKSEMGSERVQVRTWRSSRWAPSQVSLVIIEPIAHGSSTP